MRRSKRAPVWAACGAVAAGALVAQGAVISNASWTDQEWHHAPFGAVDCAESSGALLNRGEGRALSGGLLGVDLDTVAAASGVEVTNNGLRELYAPPGAQEAPEAPAYADPLNIALLNNALSIDLSEILQLPLNNSTGVLGQYGYADTEGHAAGASGYITESGGIATHTGSGYPELMTLQLSTLLAELGYDLGSLLSNVADLKLSAGALSGRATLDGCDLVWSQETTGLQREYLATSLDLAVETPTLAALTSELAATVAGLDSTVDGLAGNQSVLGDLLGAVSSLVNGLVSDVLGLGEVSVSLHASVDTSPLQDLIHPSEPLTDSGGILAIDPGNDLIVIDTVALLQAAYPGQYGTGLNGLPPNTNLLADPIILNTLIATLGTVLDDWLGQITDLLDSVIDAVEVTAAAELSLRVDAVLGTIDIGTITAVVNGSLSDLLAGTVDATITTDLNLGLLSGPLRPVVEGLVGILISGLINDLGATVGGVVSGVLHPMKTLPTTVTDLVQPVINAVSGVYSGLFLDEIVTIAVNSQNHAAGAAPAPPDWAGLPAGRFDVAALRIGVLDPRNTENVHLYLGRGSVGPTCTNAQQAACSGY